MIQASAETVKPKPRHEPPTVRSRSESILSRRLHRTFYEIHQGGTIHDKTADRNSMLPPVEVIGNTVVISKADFSWPLPPWKNNPPGSYPFSFVIRSKSLARSDTLLSHPACRFILHIVTPRRDTDFSVFHPVHPLVRYPSDIHRQTTVYIIIY